MSKGIFRICLLALVSCMLVLNSCKKKEDDEPTPGPTSDPLRDAAVQDYNSNYLGSSVTNAGWTGSVTGCVAGSVPQSTHDAVLKRLNYFRRIVGLNDNITWDTSKFSEYQEAALMMKANNKLDHYPPNTWTCYTSSGYDGAGSSNLALGTHSASAMTLFIQDPGSGNEPVGHRRWIFHSTKTTYSYGTTDASMSLGVLGQQVIPRYLSSSRTRPRVIYPSPLYLPAGPSEYPEPISAMLQYP